ncbi:MAG TPA: MMPL family transporter [Ktedonobacterales bacterium]|jgi:RND superfamily putative drug exporter|nr:MMPL family transporter [Ktedonobacterales bacterium]
MQLDDRPDVGAKESAAQPPLAAQNASTRPQADGEPHGLYRVGVGYGRLIYKLRWLVLLVWIAGLVVAAPFAAKVSSVLTGSGYSFSGSESVKVNNVLTDKLHQPKATLIVVFQSASAHVEDVSYLLEVNNFISAAKAYPHVSSVVAGGVGLDQKTTYVTVNFDQSPTSDQQFVKDFQTIVPQGADATPAQAYLTGAAPVSAAFNQLSQKDTEQAELRGLPIALAVLLIVFGTVVAGLLPLLLAAFAVPVSLGVVYAIAVHVSTSVFVLNIASIIGLGISIDYSLFMTRRFREELARGRSARDAIGWTVATAGEAILFSGLTVMIGFIGLMLIGIQFMTSFGIGGAVTVAIAALAALTLLPAVLGILGPRVNALRVPFLWRLVGVGENRDVSVEGAVEVIEERSGFWRKLALGVMAHPIIIVALVTALLLGLGWPLLSINLGTPSIAGIPRSLPARQGNDILKAQFPETNANPVLLLVQTKDGSSILTAANVGKVEQLTQWLNTQAHVSGVTSITQFPGDPQAPTPSVAQLKQLYDTGAYQKIPGLASLVAQTTNGDATIITVRADSPIDSEASKALIDQLRAGDNTHAGGLRVSVGGEQAISLDFSRYLYGNFPRSVIFILVATFLLLLIMFRSVLIPLKAIIMNALSVSASYGVLVMVFQWGYGQKLLGFESSGFVDSIIPILMFCILFGLSMDYEVFLLSRIREEWLRSHNNRWAVARGLEMTGGVITNAALLFVIVTGAFTFTQLLVTKEIGLGMTVAVLVDAAIIRTLLVPATMRLVGRWNWWLPGRPVPPKQVDTVVDAES